ncbi:MAG: prepilin-type N-terminal cleavage/methylation domain-containing protein [Candidatus Taylorbacteria bacterium]|nr:prepilin-type N-terminal cleavage/methylation domain-containing protein [Candidatus Taylorbacteria bacterium]
MTENMEQTGNMVKERKSKCCFFASLFKFCTSKSAGFTLIELLTTIAIFTVITSIVFLNQKRFGNNILVSNLAYDVALSIRQAQVYGISVKRTSQAVVSTGFEKSYGVHFALSKAFVLFVDLNDDGLYDTSSDDGNKCLTAQTIPALPSDHYPECISVLSIDLGNFISDFCGLNNLATECSGSSPSVISSLDILFHRPYPEPSRIVGTKVSGGGTSIYSSANITVSTPERVTKTVNVSPTGQISVQ